MKLYILFLYTPAIKNWGCVLYATKSFMERKSPSEKTYFSRHPGLSSKITLKLPKHKPYLSILHSWYWNIIFNFKRTLEHIINVFFKIKVNLSSWLSKNDLNSQQQKAFNNNNNTKKLKYWFLSLIYKIGRYSIYNTKQSVWSVWCVEKLETYYMFK